jgi:hypothetical protein
MTIEEHIEELAGSIDEFKRLILSLPTDVFLKRFTEWSPRDVLAHLIGWNRYTIEGSEQLRRGTVPSFFIDPGENFSKVNAKLIEQYPSADKGELLDELEGSFQELKQYLLSLDPAVWEADFGVKYKGNPITIKDLVEALIGDYRHHKEQVAGWTAGSA